MRIPKEDGPRQQFITDVMNQCLCTLESRRASYRTLKQLYLYGTNAQTDPSGVINKTFTHVDQVSSFMYAAETTKFSIDLAECVPKSELLKVPALNAAVNDEWHSTNTDILYGDALNWAFCYGSMFVKSRWNINRIESFSVEPGNIGVYREDIAEFHRQEAFVHCYVMPSTQLEYELRLANHRNVESILKEATVQELNEETPAKPVDNIVLSAASPNVIGEVELNLSAMIQYVPKVNAKMCRMYELYCFDDEIQDYRVFTLADPFVVVYDRPIEKLFLKQETPFTHICPYPLHDYMWGMSLVERLSTLQMMRNERWSQIRHMMDLQASPPKAGSGFTGDAEEIQTTMDTAAGLVISEIPGAKMESMAPEIPTDLFNEIAFIDSQFEEVSGITKVMTGQAEQGVRSEGHASTLLRVGASRAKKRALIIEDSLELLATLYLKIMQRYSDKEYTIEEGGIKFVANQFTDEFTVKVDAHSNSPIFMQDQSQIAFALFKARAINREALIKMLSPPMRDLLIQTLKTKIEPAEAKAAELQRQAEARGKVHSVK